MSTPKPKPNDPGTLDEVSLEIQRKGIEILVAADHLKKLEKDLDRLHARRAEIAGGQKFFTLDGLDE